ncbi:helix-turn-helix transcriptional regulator [Jonesiaceae bacterium BS-20]|uniref:Helix-turn-helix transcriptional regulator n=1 Tax=Jonesiaceae bacterium BS-20 TaxID=3120821 RepID=A0AAU7DTS8_9MICO
MTVMDRIQGNEATGFLTQRERVVLANLSEEITLEEVASRLFVTRNTVKSQVRSVYRKLGVSTRADAVQWARTVGIHKQ